MAYSNQNNGQDRAKENFNTDGLRFYNQGGEPYASTLKLSSWNDFIKLTINPVLPADQRTEGSNVFDYSVSMATALTTERVVLLLKAIKAEIIPALEEGRSASVAVNVAKVNRVGVMTNGVAVCLMIYRNIDPQTNLPEEKFGYIFNNDSYISDYNESDGTTGGAKVVTSEFNAFVVFLEESVKAATGVYVHQETIKGRFRSKGQSSGSSQDRSVFSAGGTTSNSQVSEDQLMNFKSEMDKILG